MHTQSICSPASYPQVNHNKNTTRVPNLHSLLVMTQHVFCPVQALSLLKCQQTRRRLQAPTPSHHLQQRQIFSQQHRSYTNTNFTTQPMRPAGKNNNNLPKNPGVPPNLLAKNSHQFTATQFSWSHGQGQGPDYSFCWFIWRVEKRQRQKTGSPYFSQCFITNLDVNYS